MDKILGNKKNIALFVLPGLLIYFVFLLIPIIYNLGISFYQTDLMSPAKFIGFKNYINLFNDVTFRQALGNNILMLF